jgi:protoheme IX farnesyltransferase
VTTLAGFTMASPATLDLALLLHTLIGTGLVAAGTLALNQFMERDVDALMERTRSRPLPGGRLQPFEALVFGAALTCGGLVYLTFLTHPAAALVTALTVASYLFAYTPMKTRTALCTLAGAIPGALPPVTGWAAASGEIGLGAVLIFGIMFFWQIPHSLAIAWLYREDYGRAGLKLLPTIHPEGGSTRAQILLNCATLLAAGLLPSITGLAGTAYFIVAMGMGLWMLANGVRVCAEKSDEAARRLLMTTFFYVPVVLLAMALDRIPAA